MEQAARRRSVENLQRLYTIVVGLAITESLRRLLSGLGGDTIITPTFASVTAVISLLFTVVPFYHGGNRYLDATYVDSEKTGKAWSLLLDFGAIFIEGIAFFVLALFINETDIFFTILAGLFIFDAVWVALTTPSPKEQVGKSPSYGLWAVVNVAAAILIWISIWSNIFNFPFWRTDTARVLFVGIVSIGRTIFDYGSVWSFYYPATSGEYVMPVPRPAPPPKKPSK